MSRQKSPPRHCVGRSWVVVVLTEQGIGVAQKSGRDLPISKWCKLFTAGGQVVGEVSEVCPWDRLCEEIVAGVLEADLEGMGGFQVGRSCDSEVGWRSRDAI